MAVLLSVRDLLDTAPEGDRLDLPQGDADAVADAEVTDTTASFHPQSLAVRGTHLEQDRRAREASSDDLPAASGPPSSTMSVTGAA